VSDVLNARRAADIHVRALVENNNTMEGDPAECTIPAAIVSAALALCYEIRALQTLIDYQAERG
jgi:hypothetical protein